MCLYCPIKSTEIVNAMGTHTIFICTQHYVDKHSINTTPNMVGKKPFFTGHGMYAGLTLLLVASIPASAMTQEIKNLFCTFLLDKATFQVTVQRCTALLLLHC